MGEDEKEDEKPSGDPPKSEPTRRDPPPKKKIEDPKAPGEPDKVKVC